MKDKKTLLFVVSNIDVFKQFFFFPGSLFDLLKDEVHGGKYEIVFVIPKEKKGVGEKMRAYCDELGGDTTVEILKMPAHSLFQKMVMFFYSYLVYTGTTKTLATMGMRAEDAPGAGRRALAPLKFFLSRTLGRSLWVKRQLVPWLYHTFLGGVLFRELFDRYKPDFVFVPNLFKRLDVEVLAEARRRGIRNVGMVTNWDHLDKYFLPFQADVFLAQSEQQKRFAIEYQAYADEQIKLVGYPYLDFVIDEQFHTGRGETLAELSFPKNAQYVLYVAGSMYCPDEPDIIEEILSWIDDGELGENVYLAIRPYPGGRGKDYAFDEKKFESFKDHQRVSFLLEPFWGDLEKSKRFINILRHAGVAVVIYSTMVLESMALDRPTLTVAFDGYNKRPLDRSVRRFALREHFKDVILSGGQPQAQNFEHLKELLSDYLNDASKDKEKREDLRRRAVYPLGGTSTRVYEALSKEL